MIIINSLDGIELGSDNAICIGNFDGMHLGHHLIISTMKSEALKNGLKSMILSFAPHPLKFFNGSFRLISTERQRLNLFESNGVDYLTQLEFNEKLASMSPESFFYDILIDKLRAKVIVVGKDYKFGKGKSGDINILNDLAKKNGIICHFINKLQDSTDLLPISSSRIRAFLNEGKVERANDLLGRAYAIQGIVVHGEKRGREIGFPTVNISPYNDIIPKNGSYASIIKVGDKKYRSMTYIGTRPTFHNGNNISIETNIFDFAGDIYDEFVEVYFYGFIRGERKYSSVDVLKESLNEDKIKAISILKGYNEN